MNNNSQQTEISLSFLLNKKQEKEYEKCAKILGVSGVEEVVKYGFTLINVVVKALEDDCEIVIVDKKKAKIMTTENAKKTAILGSPTSVKMLNKEVKELLKIEEQIQDANLGLLITDIGNYAEKNN